MYWGRNFTKAIVKAFPAHRRGKQEGETSPGEADYSGPRLRRSSSAWARIRAKDGAHRQLLRSPLRWFLVIALGYRMMATIAESSGGVGMASIFVIAVLWGAAFSRTPTFRVMCSTVLLTAAAAFSFFGVDLISVATMTLLALTLVTLAVRSLPVGRIDRPVDLEP